MTEYPTTAPHVVDRATFEARLDELRRREKAHTHEGDAIAAARRRLPMVEVDPGLTLLGPEGPLTLRDTFEERRMLIAYYFMWNPGRPAAEQCEGCSFYTSQIRELSPRSRSVPLRGGRASRTAWFAPQPITGAKELATKKPPNLALSIVMIVLGTLLTLASLSTLAQSAGGTA